MNEKRMGTPWEIAEAWYSEEEIVHSIARQRRADFDGDCIPTDVFGREFAQWLTHQYRLAMSKGIQLGRDGSSL
jgi:hypothetical protein